MRAANPRPRHKLMNRFDGRDDRFPVGDVDRAHDESLAAKAARAPSRARNKGTTRRMGAGSKMGLTYILVVI